MDVTLHRTELVQQMLCLQQSVHATVYRESRELPFDDPGEPHQRTHIIKPDGPEALPSIQDLKTGLGKPVFRDLQILIRKWQIRLTAEQLHQLPVILAPPPAG